MPEYRQLPCTLKPGQPAVSARVYKRWFICLLLLCNPAISAAESTPEVGKQSSDCSACHGAQARAWQTSHHAQAMAVATRTKGANELQLSPAVLGDFSEVSTEHMGLSATFRTVDGHPVMSLTRDKRTTHHLVTHSFGVTPLQQYLTDVGDGQRQVLPFSWDSRPESEGGQRWITLHPDEDIAPADRLHWQQPLANWNGMCADCHSTGLIRNYSSANQQFATTSTAINVGCGSCHGADPHNTNPIARGSSVGFTPRFPASATGKAKSAAVNSKLNQHRTMDICAGCHSLRSPLVDGINPELAYLDQFAPALLNPTLYFPDGQIKEEVYVWGSFLQSRMHAEGVTCGNCHDPHSQALKIEGNALCGQCHAVEKYDSKVHHQHQPSTVGAQCVSCHMPSRTYMVVDDRRDHSFHVPDPKRSKALGSPDPCTSCHQGKTQQWAAEAITSKPTDNSQRPLWELLAGSPLATATLASLLQNKTIPEILRASALEQQSQLTGPVSLTLLKSALTSAEPLLVYAAASATRSLELAQREALLIPLLGHQFRAVRVAAANQLRDSKQATDISTGKLINVLAEADNADQVSSWRGEGLLNQALHAERRGDVEAAVTLYQQAIDQDAYFEPSYINLTELFRRKGDKRREQLLYTRALRALPNSAVLRYSYALHLVRRKNPTQALVQTTQALKFEPASRSNAYLHLLLLDNVGRTEQGVTWLRNNLKHHRQSPRVLQIGVKHAQKLQDSASLNMFVSALQSLNQ